MSNEELREFKQKVANLFLTSTRNRSSWKGAAGLGGYKRWEAELLRMCGYEYSKDEGKWEEV